MTLSKIGVVGAGMMGSEIALVFALAGHDVLISDREKAVVEAGIKKLRTVLEAGISRGFYTSEQADAAMSRLRGANTLDQYADRDFVVEAVFEDERAKADVHRRLDLMLKPEAVIASNTSSISITTLGGQLPEPRRARFLGTHFFSPVSRMKLVEVIPGLDTDPAIADSVSQLLASVGKEPVRVKDVVGFAVNRLLHVFVIEAIRLVEEGVASPKDIDTACKLGLGHPVGPFELMDGVTNNLSLDVQEILHANYGPRF
ncbi:MAG: 3-hydroxyacyl-CoA dehydrogenase family protein, partial [Acetobacteraceae bacterium]|nr:3-hydroxyacyl-CoA dehydrogenase family protein [Acetobacteraceae bacterium]